MAYTEKIDPQTGQVARASSTSATSEGRVVDGRWVYGDDNNYAGSRTYTGPAASGSSGSSGSSGGSSRKSGLKAVDPSESSAYAKVKGTVDSPTIDNNSLTSGNVTTGYNSQGDYKVLEVTPDYYKSVDYDALAMEALDKGDIPLAQYYANHMRNDKIDATGSDYAKYWIDDAGNKVYQDPSKQIVQPSTISYSKSSPGVDVVDAYPWLYNAAEKSRDERTKTIEELSKNQEDQVRSEYSFARWKGIQDLYNALANGKIRYNDAVAQNAIAALQASDNLALRNAAAGDLGGIGGKLYSDQQASFDAQLGDIRNQEIQLYNQTEQQAALLEAQGRFEEAQAARQIGAEKLQSLLALQDELWNAGRDDYKWVLNYGLNYQQRAFENAGTRLGMGLLNSEDVAALGVPADQAQAVADRYNQMAQLDLESAQLGLEQMAAQLAGTNLDNATKQAKLSGTYGGGTGGSGGGGGGGGGSSYYAQKIADSGSDAMALYGSLMAAGAVDKGSALSWLLAAGYKDTNADRLATAYAAWYDGQTNKKYDAWDYRNALYNNGYYDKSQQADAELYLKKALGFSDEDAELYAESYFTWLEGQMAELARQQRIANSPHPAALALSAGDASLDSAGAGTDGLMSGLGTNSFYDLNMTNDHTGSTVYIEGRPYTRSQLETGLSEGFVKDLYSNGTHHFINAASPEWSSALEADDSLAKYYQLLGTDWTGLSSGEGAEYGGLAGTGVIPYSSILALTEAYRDGEINKATYENLLQQFNAERERDKLPLDPVRKGLGVLGKGVKAAVDYLDLEKGPYTLPADYWKNYNQER